MGSSSAGISCFSSVLVRLVTTTNSSLTAGFTAATRLPCASTAVASMRKGGCLVPCSTDSLLSVMTMLVSANELSPCGKGG